MRPLTAVEAISPALTRTRTFLFAPFRVGRSWKLAATGYLTLGGVLYLPFPLVYLVAIPILPLSAGAKLGVATAVVIATALFTFVFHLCSRLGFAFFDLMLKRGAYVAPAWRQYGPASRRWSTVKLLFGCGTTAFLALPVMAYAHNLIPYFTSLAGNPKQPLNPQIFITFFTGYFVLLLGIMAFFAIATLANDFVLPSLALENTSVREALRRFGLLLRYEPGEVLLYMVLKGTMQLAGSMAINLAFQLAFLLIGLAFALVGGLIGYGLHMLGAPLPALWLPAGVLGVPVMLLLAGYGLFLGMGSVATFLQAYLLYFLGGRYPALGELLEPTAPESQAR